MVKTKEQEDQLVECFKPFIVQLPRKFNNSSYRLQINSKWICFSMFIQSKSSFFLLSCCIHFTFSFVGCALIHTVQCFTPPCTTKCICVQVEARLYTKGFLLVIQFMLIIWRNAVLSFHNSLLKYFHCSLAKKLQKYFKARNSPKYSLNSL